MPDVPERPDPVSGESAPPAVRHTGRAVAAPVLAVATLAVALTAAARLPDWMGRPDPVAAPAGTPVSRLAVGQCFNRDRTAPSEAPVGSAPAPVRVVPCTGPHDTEVTGTATPTAGPGTPLGDVTDQGETLCRTSLGRYVLDPISLPRDTRTYWYVLLPSPWRVDGARLLCAVTTDEPVSRPLREDATTLAADQVRYLEAIQDSQATMDSLEASDPETGWRERRVLAARMADVLTRERASLAEGHWPAPVGPAMRQLVTAETAAIAVWRRAGAARSADRMETLIDEAVGATLEQHRTVRQRLGLSTFQGEPAQHA